MHYKVGIKSFNRFNKRRLAHGPYIFGEGTINKTTSNKTKRLNFLLHTTQTTGILLCVCAKRLRDENARKEKQIKVVPTKRSILTVNKILPSKMGQFTESTIMTKSSSAQMSSSLKRPEMYIDFENWFPCRMQAYITGPPK
jgi:hypothetical protein